MKSRVLLENIKEIARERGMSISEIERKAGLARGHISKFSYIKTPQLDTVVRIAEILGVPLERLLRE